MHDFPRAANQHNLGSSVEHVWSSMLASLGARRTGLSSPKIVMGQGNPRDHAAAPTIYRMTSIMAWPMMRTVVFAESLNGKSRPG